LISIGQRNVRRNKGRIKKVRKKEGSLTSDGFLHVGDDPRHFLATEFLEHKNLKL
jgi:hypothetical protein